MHNEDIERGPDDAGDLRTSVEAADDTGLVRQQELLSVAELGDAPTDEREGGA